MKRTASILFLGFMVFLSCTNNDDGNNTVNATFNFTHHWDGTAITNANFNNIQYTNANGESLSIEKLRYLISNVTFHKSNGETIVFNGYNLVNVTTNSDMQFSLNNVMPTGAYDNISFTFGFNNNDNYQNYQDLNSVLWNVPMMLGGGYHFMQLEGKFIDDTMTETGYAYHTIRAVDNSGAELVFQDTFFEVNLGAVTISENNTFEIKMNVAEWFKNPNQWDLTILNNMLMPNFDAQIMMHDNGLNVFSLGEIIN